MPIHLVLKSNLAKGSRSLLKNKTLVEQVLNQYSKRFQIQVYEYAICGNHIHLCIKGKTRYKIQHFFRVFSRQIAQRLLNLKPLPILEPKAFDGGIHPKSKKTFWSYIVFTRIANWGRDFSNLKLYILRNTLEALGIIEYSRPKKSSGHFLSNQLI